MEFIKNSWTSGDEKILICPICQIEYTHLTEVAEYHSDKKSEERLGVILSFECENGHAFNYKLHNHKGYTVSSYTVEKEEVK